MARTNGHSLRSMKVLIFIVPFLLHLISAQNCGSEGGGALCQPGYCCSIYSYCGQGDDWCAPGNCQSQCPSAPTPPSPDIPGNCFRKNGIPVGWLPDYNFEGGRMTAITSRLGASTCFYGLYSQITSNTYDDSQLTSRMNDIKSSGAILQAAVMPTRVRFANIGTNLASQIAASMKKFTDNGIEVWLRFAHEMNWYVRQESGPTYAGGTTAEFITAWRNVANAVRGNSKVKMFWTPNNVGTNTASLDAWWPGADYVDIVGIDIYPSSSEASSFSGVYGSFINRYANGYNKNFAIGETGATDASTKRKWLAQISSAQSLAQYPRYVGWSWFEFYKDGEDFRVVTGSENIAKAVLMNSGLESAYVS